MDGYTARYLHEYAKPFFFEGGDSGCLIIHDFTGSPARMRLLGEVLHGEGYTVNGILLKGHGTSLKDMERTCWHDWIDDTVKGYEVLRKRCDRVYVIGLSMGGVLALLLAGEYPVDKIVSIAAPVRVYNKWIYFSPVLKYFIPVVKWSRPVPVEGEAIEYDVGYFATPAKCVQSLVKLIRMARKNLPRITCPALIIQSRMDRTVKPVSAQIIFDKIASSKKEILWLECSRHICTVGPEREVMHKKILSFLKN